MLALLKTLDLSNSVDDGAATVAAAVQTAGTDGGDFAEIRDVFERVAQRQPIHGDLAVSSRRLVSCLQHLAQVMESDAASGRDGARRIAAAELAKLWLPRPDRIGAVDKRHAA